MLAMRLPLAAAILFLTLPSTLPASEPITAAMDFWKVLVEGDVSKLQEHYAEEVVLQAGSEFLNKQWGINPSGDRYKQDVKVTRADLMKAYAALFQKAGKEKWTVCARGRPW